MNKNESALKRAFRAAFPATIPVLTGFMVLGIAYGILMHKQGYGPLWTLLYSMVAFCGSMQYVAIAYVVAPFLPLQVLLLTVMVNARHLFYGMSMLGKYRDMGFRKWICIYMLCDETFAINSAAEIPEDVDKKTFYTLVSLLNWSYWAAAGLLGNLLGSLLVFNTKGLDFALTALFVVLFIDQMKDRKSALLGFIGVGAAVVSCLIFGAANMVIPAMILILGVLLLWRNKLCD